MRSRARALIAMLLTAGLLLGCDEGAPQMLDWDLSASHRPSDAGWDDPDTDARSVDKVESMRIQLPEGRVFEAADDVRDVILGREEGVLDLIQVTFEEQTAAGAYERATALVAEWGLDGRNIDEWYAEAKGKTGSEAAEVDVSGAFAEVFGPDADAGRIGPQGPAVTVEVRYSFDDETPFLVGYELTWAPTP